MQIADEIDAKARRSQARYSVRLQMGTVAKALTLLSLFNRLQMQIGLSDMARLAGMNKATTHRLLGELQSHGFVEQIGAGREYRLGPAVLRLASLRENTVPMRDAAQKVLQELADITGETAHFSLLQGQALVTNAYAYSQDHGTRVTMEDAEILPFHATSSGIAVLAHGAQQLIDNVLVGPMPPRTAHTITTPDKLRAIVDKCRATGIAEMSSGFEDDVHSFACPIFDAAETAIGAMAVAMPVTRVTHDATALIQSELRAKALELTRLLGGFAPQSYSAAVAA